MKVGTRAVLIDTETHVIGKGKYRVGYIGSLVVVAVPSRGKTAYMQAVWAKHLHPSVMYPDNQLMWVPKEKLRIGDEETALHVYAELVNFQPEQVTGAIAAYCTQLAQKERPGC